MVEKRRKVILCSGGGEVTGLVSGLIKGYVDEKRYEVEGYSSYIPEVSPVDELLVCIIAPGEHSGLGRLLYSALQYEVPVVMIADPRLQRDSRYLYDRVKSIFSANVSYSSFDTRFKEVFV